MNILYLTNEERKMFDALPANLREGWGVESEVLSYQDTWERWSARLSLVRLHDPKLFSLKETVVGMKTEQEVLKALQDIDLKSVADDDLAELFFALGPNGVSRFVAWTLERVASDKDLEAVSALCVVRHSLLTALVSQ